MNAGKVLNKIRKRRVGRVRAKILGTAERPRLAISRSRRAEYLQLIDDKVGRTLVSATRRELKKKSGTKTELAAALGEFIAKKASELGIKKAVTDRRYYKYHGRVEAVVEGARKGGLSL